MQDTLQAIVIANPSRETGYEDNNQLPNMTLVRRFVARNGLSVRKTMEIKRGRQLCTVNELMSWFDLTKSFFNSTPDLVSATRDPQRLFNQVTLFENI